MATVCLHSAPLSFWSGSGRTGACWSNGFQRWAAVAWLAGFADSDAAPRAPHRRCCPTRCPAVSLQVLGTLQRRGHSTGHYLPSVCCQAVVLTPALTAHSSTPFLLLPSATCNVRLPKAAACSGHSATPAVEATLARQLAFALPTPANRENQPPSLRGVAPQSTSLVLHTVQIALSCPGQLVIFEWCTSS